MYADTLKERRPTCGSTGWAIPEPIDGTWYMGQVIPGRESQSTMLRSLDKTRYSNIKASFQR